MSDDYGHRIDEATDPVEAAVLGILDDAEARDEDTILTAHRIAQARWGLRDRDKCAVCRHERDSHSSGGMCDGAGTECYCVRFPDSPGDWHTDGCAGNCGTDHDSPPCPGMASGVEPEDPFVAMRERAIDYDEPHVVKERKREALLALPPWHHERPWSSLELDDIRHMWIAHPEWFSYAAGRWLATLDAATDGLREALWSIHQATHDQENDETFCASCHAVWPCPTAEVLLR